MTKTIAAYVIRTDRTHGPIGIRTDHELEDLYSTIGCQTFDVLTLNDKIDMFVDDEALINGSRLNLALTVLSFRLGAETPIFGNGVLVGTDPRTGKTLSLTTAQRERIQTALTTPPDDATATAITEALRPMHNLGDILRTL